MMAALPLEAVVPESVSGAVHGTPNAVGLAVIISNDYSTAPGGLGKLNGALQDGQALSSAFTKLKFAVCWVRNASRHSLGKILSELRNLKFSMVRNYRCILFIFAGHGCEGDCLYMQDGSKFEVFSSIIDPLLPKNSKEIGNIEKVFLIDACRGPSWTPTSLVPRSAGLVRGGTPLDMQEVAQEGGFMLAYSTLPRSKAFEDPHSGGLWFSTLARLLRERRHLCSVDNLLTQVNAEMKRKMHGTQFQQPEKLSRLNKIICLNPECRSCCATEAGGSGFESLASNAGARPGALVSRPPAKHTDALNMQGHFRGVLNNYHQTGIISQPEPVDDELNNVFHCSITVKIVSVSPVKVIVGKGSSDKNKAMAREAAARDACNKIQGAITANGRGVSASQLAIKKPTGISPSTLSATKKTSGVAASISPPPAVKKKATSNPPPATSNPPPAKKKNLPDVKSAKSKLKEYFDARGLTDKDTVKYDPRPAEGGGFVCTVTCPFLKHPISGERFNKKQEAIHSAAQKALNQLL